MSRSQSAPAAEDGAAHDAAIPFHEALRVWVRVALQSFGGPAGQIAVIHRIVVDEKHWIDERRFMTAMSYCMLLPGPEAQQLATYLGWSLHGVRGGLTAGVLFVLPGFLVMLVLSIVYALYGDAALLAAVFSGLKPAVLAIVLISLARLFSRVATGRAALVIAAGAFLAVFAFAVPFPAVIVVAALVGVLSRSPSREVTRQRGGGFASVARVSTARTARIAAICLALWIIPVLLLLRLLGPEHVLVRESLFFSRAALVTFGGAYAVLSYVAQQAVGVYGWLNPGEMLDGLGLAETTPGPLIMVVQFVGFLGAYRLMPDAGILAGVAGALVTVWVTFVPCFLFVFVGAPYVELLNRSERLHAALGGVTAAVLGVVLNLAVWFAVHTLFGEVTRIDSGLLSFDAPVLASTNATAACVAVAALVALGWLRLQLGWVLLGSMVAGICLG